MSAVLKKTGGRRGFRTQIINSVTLGFPQVLQDLLVVVLDTEPHGLTEPHVSDDRSSKGTEATDDELHRCLLRSFAYYERYGVAPHGEARRPRRQITHGLCRVLCRHGIWHARAAHNNLRKIISRTHARTHARMVARACHVRTEQGREAPALCVLVCGWTHKKKGAERWKWYVRAHGKTTSRRLTAVKRT